MQENSANAQVNATKPRHLVNMLCIFWARSFGSVLGTYMQFVSRRKIYANFYLMFLQSYRYLSYYLTVDFVDTENQKPNINAKTDCVDPIKLLNKIT